MTIPRLYQLPVAQDAPASKPRAASTARSPVAKDDGAEPTATTTTTSASSTAPPTAGNTAGSQHAAVVLAPTLGAAAAAHGSGEAAASQRVANVRAQLRAGTYRVDRQALTEKLVEEELARVPRGTKR